MPNNNFGALLKRKPFMIVAAVAVVFFSVYCIRDFAAIARNNHLQGLLRNMNAIMDDADKLPPGIPRAEELVRRLKALDTGLSPMECKQALGDYTAAMEGGLATQYDAPMADAKQRLAECFRKYR